MLLSPVLRGLDASAGRPHEPFLSLYQNIKTDRQSGSSDSLRHDLMHGDLAHYDLAHNEILYTATL
jgi:hypothetical protein